MIWGMLCWTCKAKKIRQLSFSFSPVYIRPFYPLPIRYSFVRHKKEKEKEDAQWGNQQSLYLSRLCPWSTAHISAREEPACWNTHPVSNADSPPTSTPLNFAALLHKPTHGGSLVYFESHLQMSQRHCNPPKTCAAGSIKHPVPHKKYDCSLQNISFFQTKTGHAPSQLNHLTKTEKT